MIAHAIPSTAAFPETGVGRLLRSSFRGLLSVYSRYGLPARLVAFATFCTRGFNGFVASTAALIATEWSEPVLGRDSLPLWISRIAPGQQTQAAMQRISCKTPEFNKLDDQMQNMQKPDHHDCVSTLEEVEGSNKRRLQMQRRLTWVALLSIAMVITALYQARKVHATPAHDYHHGCSVASLKGTYAYLNTGVTNTGLDGPVAELGIALFNGDGERGPIRRTSSVNGVIQDWTNSPPHGSYTIDPDCTGSFFSPGPNAVKTYNIVVLDGGKRFLLLDLEPNTIITAEATRIDDVEEKD